MQIKPVTIEDIPCWRALSAEYDTYVGEVVNDLAQWYEGGGDGMAFAAYMRSKIAQKEAFMAIDPNGHCLGIIALSRRKNRITFFGVTHKADLAAVGSALLLHAFAQLNPSRGIHINEIASPSAWIDQHRQLLIRLGFKPDGCALENGAPVDVFLRPPSM